jgi:hypothetical protein
MGVSSGMRTRIISIRPAEPTEEKMYYEWRKNGIPTDCGDKGI